MTGRHASTGLGPHAGLMKTRWPLVVLAVAVGAGACAGQPLSSLTTSLTGFTVLRSARPITSFRSDDQGHFTVHLAPGA